MRSLHFIAYIIKKMNRNALTIYLNDHLAGSVAAIELLVHLQRKGDIRPKRFLTHLLHEIEADQAVLQSVIKTFHGRDSHFKKAGGWLSEKFLRLKLFVADMGKGKLAIFEALEILSLGIEGKRSLWRTLATLADRFPDLRKVDLDHLEERAKQQRQELDQWRLRFTNVAF